VVCLITHGVTSAARATAAPLTAAAILLNRGGLRFPLDRSTATDDRTTWTRWLDALKYVFVAALGSMIEWSTECRPLRGTALHCTALRCAARHCTALRCTALRCAARHCAALRGTALRRTALRCAALHCVALHCAALQVCRSATCACSRRCRRARHRRCKVLEVRPINGIPRCATSRQRNQLVPC
jgi:hypothetical protein